MRPLATILLCILLFSCKAKKGVLVAMPKSPVKENSALTVDQIIANYNNVKVDFKTINIRSSIAYEDYKNSQSVSADIKIKKDEIIHVNVKFLGFPVAKALITPKEVKYYEKVGGKYFEGNFETLSKWLGNDLNFNKLQNLLLGKALDDLTKEKLEMSLQETNYQLKATANNVEKLFLMDTNKFLLQKQEYNQPSKNRKLSVSYPNFNTFTEAILPSGMAILALVNDKTTKIDIEYDAVSFNEELNFSYSVPEGYKKININ
jgi:hypothetical protein